MMKKIGAQTTPCLQNSNIMLLSCNPKGEEMKKSEIPTDMVLPARAVSSTSVGVGREEARTQHPSATWTTAMSLLSAPPGTSTFPICSSRVSQILTDVTFSSSYYTQDGYHCYDT